MLQRICHLCVFILIAAVLLTGCSDKKQIDESGQTEPEATVSVTVTETDNSEESQIQVPSESSAETSSPTSSEIPSNSEPSVVTPSTQTPDPIIPSEKPPKKPTETTSSEPEQKKPAPISAISYSLQEYISKGEPSPYIKGIPIYQLLYNGSRVQIGDTLSYRLNVFPTEHSGSLKVSSSDNLSCTLSGNVLTVKILSADQYGMGSVSVLGMNGQAVTTSIDIMYTVDDGGNPYNEFAGILADYIRHNKMEYCTVTNGYTQNNPSLSITHYSDAPAWDDMIDKSSGNWISKAFWLVDEYAKHSFNKINFIITDTSIGFCASK